MVPAELVLLNGNIVTMNPNMPSAQAIAVKGGRIVCVGSDQEVRQYVDVKTQVICLDGKTVMPGFIDTHAHVVDYGRMLAWMDLGGVSSIRELQRRLAERVKQVGVGKWVLGRGLDFEGLLDGRLPLCGELDAVSPDNPVVFYCESGQVCVVNSKVIEVAKIVQQNDVGVERDLAGVPTGVLLDNATNFVWSVIPEPTLQEFYDATVLALSNFVKAGITSVHWIVLSEVELLIIQKLVEATFLPLRVYLIVPTSLLDLALLKLKRFENAFFKFGGGLIFVDGYLASRTAALLEPYNDNSSNQGKTLCSQSELLMLADKIQSSGLQLIIHAVGDHAVQEAVNVIPRIKENPTISYPRLEQAAVLNQQLIQCIKELNLSVSVQPCVVDSEFSVWSAKERLGERRLRWLFPVKELLDCGVLVSAGSDCPMEPLNPLLGIEAAVKREGLQKVSVFEALQMYTVFAAQISSELFDKGSIEQGKFADLVVLSDNPLSIAANNIGSVSVCFTVLDGVVCCSKK